MTQDFRDFDYRAHAASLNSAAGRENRGREGATRASHAPSRVSGTGAEASDSLDQALVDELALQRVRREARRVLDAEERSVRPIPVPVSLTELLAEPEEPVEYLIDGLWPANGRVVLSAPMKSGKTTLVGNLARSLADGVPFLGRFATASVNRVVIIDDEMSRAQIRKWLSDQGIVNTDNVFVYPIRGEVSSFDITDPERRAEVATRLRDLGTEVLIVDCLRPILDALGLSEDKDAGKFLAALDELCNEAEVTNYGVSVHAGHSGERARGDSRIRDWPDAEWNITRDLTDNHSPRFFSAFGRDVDVPEGRLDFDPVTRHLSIAVGVTRADVGNVSATRTLLEAALAKPGATTNDLKATIPGSNDTKAQKIRFCVSQGFLTTAPGRNNSVMHTLTPEGEVWLRAHALGAPPGIGDPVIPSDPP